MKTIHKLPEEVVAKIAAGEVIERPSYAVKELIENALDAHATVITIQLEDSGLTKIRVTDNGVGMSEEDTRESWGQHTTSKITDESDLHTVTSFGFRGEALSSLAAVSVLTIQSRVAQNPTGLLITIDNGKLTRDERVGMPSGTIITVEQLFRRLPARRKFLKSERTELRLIMDTVNRFALSRPDIQFTLSHGKKTLLYYPSSETLADRAEQVIGPDVFPLYIPFQKEDTYMKVSGFLAKPQMTTSSVQKQYLFMNKRMVSDKLISGAIKEAYGTMLESATYPLFVLFVSLPSELLDINVHPRKEQVRFMDPSYIFQTTKQIVSEVLTENNLTFQNLSWSKSGAGLTTSIAGKMLKESVLEKEAFETSIQSQYVQFHNLYIVEINKTEVNIYDQHAAHERELFEKIKQDFLHKKDSDKPFALPKGIALTLSREDTLIMEEYIHVFEKFGFRIQHNTVTHVPNILRDRDPKELIGELLETLVESGTARSLDRVSEEMLAFLACRSAVKAGDKLTVEQMKKIVTDLSETPNSATCPHGRPTKIAMTLKELDTLFHR